MIVLLKIIHVVVSVLLIVIVLLQFGRGSEIGAVFGGTSTQAVFGSSAPTVLEKVTIVLAAIFMLTSGILAYMATHRESVFDKAPVERKIEKQEAPPAGVFPQAPTGVEK